MKRFTFAFVLLTGLSFLFSQCGSADSAAKTADQFFSLIIKKDFENAEKMIDVPLGNTTDLGQQVRLLENNDTNGQLLAFKKSFGFETSINNGIKTVKLNYVLKYDKGNRTYQVVIVNRGGGDKIVAVQ